MLSASYHHSLSMPENMSLWGDETKSDSNLQLKQMTVCMRVSVCMWKENNLRWK